MNRIDVVIFDLGGVLIEIDFSRCLTVWANEAKLPYAVIHERYEIDEAYKQHERGLIDARQYFESLRQSLQVTLSDEQFMAGWQALILEPVVDIAAQLDRASADSAMVMFSNTNPAHFEPIAKNQPDLVSRFDQCFLSYQLGLRKPDKPAFQAVLSELSVAPQNALFFDDTAANVIAAREMGIHAVQVGQTADIRDALSQFGFQ